MTKKNGKQRRKSEEPQKASALPRPTGSKVTPATPERSKPTSLSTPATPSTAATTTTDAVLHPPRKTAARSSPKCAAAAENHQQMTAIATTTTTTTTTTPRSTASHVNATETTDPQPYLPDPPTLPTTPRHHPSSEASEASAGAISPTSGTHDATSATLSAPLASDSDSLPDSEGKTWSDQLRHPDVAPTPRTDVAAEDGDDEGEGSSAEAPANGIGRGKPPRACRAAGDDHPHLSNKRTASAARIRVDSLASTPSDDAAEPLPTGIPTFVGTRRNSIGAQHIKKQRLAQDTPAYSRASGRKVAEFLQSIDVAAEEDAAARELPEGYMFVGGAQDGRRTPPRRRQQRGTAHHPPNDFFKGWAPPTDHTFGLEYAGGIAAAAEPHHPPTADVAVPAAASDAPKSAEEMFGELPAVVRAPLEVVEGVWRASVEATARAIVTGTLGLVRPPARWMVNVIDRVSYRVARVSVPLAAAAVLNARARRY
ncbi:hypothetical protein HDU96_002946 [Phlyctochytrium bullatum]|nr:hypothetical protein HDU96_002946 [Phlyctochytrium bullatum]